MKTLYPKAKHGIVNRVTGSIFKYQGWPTVARDENGTLYVGASGFRIGHVCPFGKTVMYISKNEGESWTPPIVINDTYMDDRDAGLIYMGNGKMLLSWFCLPLSDYSADWWLNCVNNWNSPEGVKASYGMLDAIKLLPENKLIGGSFLRTTDDYGVTWGETIRLPISAPHGPSMCRDGSLVYLGLEFCSEGELPHKSVALYKSRDKGNSWEKVSVIPSPSWLAKGEFLDEPHIIELPDGRLLGAFRTEPSFRIATTFSSDGGKSWDDVTMTEATGAPPHLMLHSSGAVICSYGRRHAPNGERAMVSYNGGESWEEEYILSESPSGDLGYPSTVELADGSLITVYYQRYDGDAYPSVLYTKWSLDEGSDK